MLIIASEAVVSSILAIRSNPNFFDLLQREDIRGPVIELGGTRGGVGGDGLRFLDRPPVLQVGGDSRCPAMPGPA